MGFVRSFFLSSSSPFSYSLDCVDFALDGKT